MNKRTKFAAITLMTVSVLGNVAQSIFYDYAIDELYRTQDKIVRNLNDERQANEELSKLNEQLLYENEQLTIKINEIIESE